MARYSCASVKCRRISAFAGPVMRCFRSSGRRATLKDGRRGFRHTLLYGFAEELASVRRISSVPWLFYEFGRLQSFARDLQSRCGWNIRVLLVAARRYAVSGVPSHASPVEDIARRAPIKARILCAAARKEIFGARLTADPARAVGPSFLYGTECAPHPPGRNRNR